MNKFFWWSVNITLRNRKHSYNQGWDIRVIYYRSWSFAGVPTLTSVCYPWYYGDGAPSLSTLFIFCLTSCITRFKLAISFESFQFCDTVPYCFICLCDHNQVIVCTQHYMKYWEFVQIYLRRCNFFFFFFLGHKFVNQTQASHLLCIKIISEFIQLIRVKCFEFIFLDWFYLFL